MNWSGTTNLVIGLGALSMASMACDRAVSQEGDQGNLEFLYTPADGDRDFARPIALGSGLEMSVAPLGDRELEQVLSVSTDPDTILGAELIDDGEDEEEEEDLFLWGIDVGESVLSVEVEGGGERYSDSTTMRVSRVTQVAMAHECARGDDAAYMVDQAVSLELDRRNHNGETLVGASYSTPNAVDTCQVQITPSYFQEEAYCDEGGLHFWPIQELGPIDVELTSGIEPAGRSSSEISIHIIDPSHVDFEVLDGDLPVDGTRRFELEPFTTPISEVGTWPVCSHLDLYVEILTPDTCSGPTGELSFFVEPEEENEVRLRGQESGRCEFAVELADRPDLGDWIFSVMVRE